MEELKMLDLGIIGLYLVVMLLVGVWFVKRIKNTDDYYVAGRTLGPVVLAATVCATIIGGSAMMGRAGIAYTTGFKAIATAIPYMLGMFIFSGYAGRIQKVGEKYNIESIPSLFEFRFGKAAKVVLAAMVAFAMVGTVAAQVTATATIIKLLGGQVGISYEINRWVGRHDNLCSRILSAPGKWLQRLTTNEPDDSMIECAIRALELVIPEQKGSDAW